MMMYADVSTEKPDCWDRLEKVFGVDWNSGIVVAWKGKIHTKVGKVSDHIYVHEQVHLKQQEKYSPDDYLDKYIEDIEFRFQMELEAFQAEIAYIREFYKKAIVEDKIDKICRTLSSSIYGNIISYEEIKKIL